MVVLRREFLRAAGTAAASAASAAPARPNIVLILADDMGYSDLGCFGAEIRTPNLDRLASRGVRFTHFYNTARCCPSRASLLTGMYSHQAGVGHMTNERPLPAYRGDLSHSYRTVAELLSATGYRCYMAGKWHVTPSHARNRANLPLQRGFHRYYGTLAGGHHFAPRDLMDGNERVPAPLDFYYADAMTAKSVQFLKDHSSRPEPFFLYTAYTAPHFPLQCPDDDVARQRGRYSMGWERLREQRFYRQRELGIVDRSWRLPARDANVKAWEGAANPEWEQRRMEVYAAMVERMDRGIGEVLAQVRAMGQEDNTLVMFLSDNGGSAELMDAQNTVNRVPPHLKASGRWQGNDPSVMPGPADTYQSYGPAWASASNAPFRRFKSMTHEGGIATPLIAAWGANVKRPGSLNHQPGHIIDLLPTCLDAAGEAPAKCEGISFLPALRGSRRREHESICFEHQGNQAIRSGDWKLVRARGGDWELYQVRDDRTETRDHASSESRRTTALLNQYKAWMSRCGVWEWEEVLKSDRSSQG